MAAVQCHHGSVRAPARAPLAFRATPHITFITGGHNRYFPKCSIEFIEHVIVF